MQHDNRSEENINALADEMEECEFDNEQIPEQQQTFLPRSEPTTTTQQNIRPQSSALSGRQDLFNIAMLTQIFEQVHTDIREQLHGEIEQAATQFFGRSYCQWRDARWSFDHPGCHSFADASSQHGFCYKHKRHGKSNLQQVKERETKKTAMLRERAEEKIKCAMERKKAQQERRHIQQQMKRMMEEASLL